MDTSQAVILPPLQSPLRSRPGERDCLLPRLSALAYQTIDSETGDIRLVELLPGRYSDMIQMNLHTKNLGDKPNYEALSYAWGTIPSSNRAIINGCPVPVRGSLDLGLRRLRHTDEPRTLWIDALCINQNDVRERSHQVQQMRMIYKYAKQVVIWLGEWPDLDTCPYPGRCQSIWIEWLDGLSALSSTEKDDLLPPEHICQHAVEIGKLPWFRRLWIIQEFVLASSKKMILGDRVTSSAEFLSAIQHAVGKSAHYRSPSASDRKQQEQLMLHLHMFMEIELNLRVDGAITLYESWILSRYFMATDPRDKIYGLLGIVKFYVAQPIVPDYSKAWPQVLAEATIVMISEAGLSAYMCDDFAFPSASRPKQGYRIPSWVLDLSQSHDCALANAEELHKQAVNSEEAEYRRKSLRLSEDSRTLYKHGWYIGTIHEVFVFTVDSIFVKPASNSIRAAAGLYDFYHNILKPKGIAPVRLYEGLNARLPVLDSLECFTFDLSQHRDDFLPFFRGDWFSDFKLAVFLTGQGDVGITWLHSTSDIEADDVLVALFERQMPFILRPIQEDFTFRMINLAYISGHSGDYCKGYRDTMDGNDISEAPHDWVYGASEGCLRYAIV